MLELKLCKCGKALGAKGWKPLPSCFNPKPDLVFKPAQCPDCARRDELIGKIVNAMESKLGIMPNHKRASIVADLMDYDDDRLNAEAKRYLTPALS